MAGPGHDTQQPRADARTRGRRGPLPTRRSAGARRTCTPFAWRTVNVGRTALRRRVTARRQALLGTLDHEALAQKDLPHALAQVALQFDTGLEHRSARAARALQLAAESRKEGGVAREPVDPRDTLAPAALLLEPQLRDHAGRDTFGCRARGAFAVALRPSAARTDAARLGGVDQTRAGLSNHPTIICEKRGGRQAPPCARQDGRTHGHSCSLGSTFWTLGLLGLSHLGFVLLTQCVPQVLRIRHWTLLAILAVVFRLGGLLQVRRGAGARSTRSAARSGCFGKTAPQESTATIQAKGLAIVRDLAAAYGGAIDLEQPALGGPRARLDLPAAQ